MREEAFGLGNVRRHAPEHVDGLLDRFALFVLLEVALLEDGERVLAEVRMRDVAVARIHRSPFGSVKIVVPGGAAAAGASVKGGVPAAAGIGYALRALADTTPHERARAAKAVQGDGG
jgi:hypothetical protein